MQKGFIHHPQRVWVRRALFQVHLWTWVLAGLYLLAISVSGSVLVFQRELMNDAPETAFPKPVDGVHLTYGQIVEELERHNPTIKLRSIDMRSRRRRIVTLNFLDKGRDRVFYVDRESGRTLGGDDLRQLHPVLTWMEELHNELLGGSTGATVNGIGGLLLVTLCGTGIVIWWPGLRIWRRALTIKWRAGWRRVNFDLHSAVGFWTLVVILMWGVTGAYFIFPSLIQKPLHLFATPVGAKPSRWVTGGRLQSIDTYLSAAVGQFPGKSLAYLYMDVFRANGQVGVFLSTDPSVPLTLREDIVHLDPATADVLSTESSTSWSPLERVLMATYSLHFGDFGGVLSKVIWSILGIGLSLLTITAYLMWWNRVLRKRWPFR